MTIKPRQMMVSSSKYGIKCPYSMDAEYITFHNTANDATADNEVSYMTRNNSEISFHFAIDDKEVVQGIPTNRNAWHCGDGNGTGNRKSIGVEICYSKSGGERYRKAEALAIKFIAQLLHERNWGIDRVRTHKSWTEIGVKKGYSRYVKNCPHRVLDECRWNEVLDAIDKELKSLKGKKVTESPKQEEKHDSPPTSKPNVSGSVVDYMNSKGMDSSYSNRAKLATQFGIKGYNGSAEENLRLLEYLQKGTPKNESKPTSKPSTNHNKGDMKTNSIVTYLNSIGVNSSFSNRRKLASQYNIKAYIGSASQNLRLLDAMRDGNKVGSKPVAKPKPTVSSGIKSIGKIKIVGVSNAAIIMDKPDRNNSKNIGTIGKGQTINISGSVKGKNNPDGYWEVIYKNERKYISGQYGKLV